MTSSTSTTMCQFSIGDEVIHANLGKGVVRKLAREDGKVLFEFIRLEKEHRIGAGRRRLAPVTYNRWVYPSTLARRISSTTARLIHDEDSEDEDNDTPEDDESVDERQPESSSAASAGRKRDATDRDEQLDADLGERPKLSAHERSRAKKLKAGGGPTRARLGAAGLRKTPVSKVAPERRCKEFNEPVDQGFFVTCGKIKCAPCGEFKYNKWSTLSTHVKSVKHQENLAKWKARTCSDTMKKYDIAAYYAAHPDESMGSLDADELLFRYRLTEAFLGNGLPLSKADGMRNLFRRTGHASTNSSHLACFIPQIEKSEIDLLLSEIKGQYVSTSFDGTTRLGEAVNMVNRWCSASFHLVQRLTMFRTVEKHMDHRQLARLIGEKLLHELHVTVAQHISFQRDSVKVNGCAVERLTSLLDLSEDILCVCHTLCHVGERFNLPTLQPFMRHWIGLVYSNNAAKMAWKEMLQSAVVGYSSTRWYSVAEIEMQIAENYGLLPNILDTWEDRGIGDAHTKGLRQIFDDNTVRLQAEFASMLDQRQLVRTTYELEGDRLEILVAYDRIEALRYYGRHLGEPGTLPNLDAVLKKHMQIGQGTRIAKLWQGIGMCDASVVEVINNLESTLRPGSIVKGYKVRYDMDGEEEDLEDAEIRQWLRAEDSPHRADIIAGLREGYVYLEDRLTGNCDRRYDCSHEHLVFRLVRAFNPAFAYQQKIDVEWVDEMAAIVPFAADGIIDGLKEDLPKYLAAAQDAVINQSDLDHLTSDVLQWWRNNGAKCPKWAQAARRVFAMSPNSAACERVFSLLESMFSAQQTNSLSDQLQASLMLKYNKREVG